MEWRLEVNWNKSMFLVLFVQFRAICCCQYGSPKIASIFFLFSALKQRCQHPHEFMTTSRPSSARDVRNISSRWSTLSFYENNPQVTCSYSMLKCFTYQWRICAMYSGDHLISSLLQMHFPLFLTRYAHWLWTQNQYNRCFERKCTIQWYVRWSLVI